MQEKPGAYYTPSAFVNILPLMTRPFIGRDRAE